MWYQLFNDPKLLAIAATLAAIPVGVYMWFFLKKKPEPRRMVIKTFLFGCLSVVPLAFMQYLFAQYSDIDMYSIIRKSIYPVGMMWLMMYLFIGMTEEYFKHLVVVVADNRDKEFKRIADGIELSIIAALGFSFVEHIVYFISIYHRGGWEELIVPFVFRSILTTLAHTCFSGIYGYYYGKSHFIKNVWQRQKMVFRGLLSAMILHGIFNLLLEFDIVWGIVPLLMIELSFILNELRKKRNNAVHYGRDIEVKEEKQLIF